MRKVNHTGYRFAVVFTDGQSSIEFGITEREYRSKDSIARFGLTLEQVTRGWVVPPGYRLAFAYEPPTFDTPDGKLADEQYAVVGDHAFVKKPGRVVATVRASMVVNGTLNSDGERIVAEAPEA